MTAVFLLSSSSQTKLSLLVKPNCAQYMLMLPKLQWEFVSLKYMF